MSEEVVEESYYYRLTPTDGFAIQRLYTRDTDLDVSVAVGDGDLASSTRATTRSRPRRARTPTTSTSWPVARARIPFGTFGTRREIGWPMRPTARCASLDGPHV